VIGKYPESVPHVECFDCFQFRPAHFGPAEVLHLSFRQVFPIFQKQISAFLQYGFISAFIPADIIDSPVQNLHNVKPIKDDFGFAEFLTDSFENRLGHIADELPNLFRFPVMLDQIFL